MTDKQHNIASSKSTTAGNIASPIGSTNSPPSQMQQQQQQQGGQGGAFGFTFTFGSNGAVGPTAVAGGGGPSSSSSTSTTTPGGIGFGSPLSSNSTTSSLGGMGSAEKSDEEMARLTEAMCRMMSSDSIAGIPSPGHAMPSPHTAEGGPDGKPEFPAIPPDEVLSQSERAVGGGTKPPGKLDDPQQQQQQQHFQPIVAPHRVDVGGDGGNGGFGGAGHLGVPPAGGGGDAGGASALPPPPPVFQFGEREFYGYGVSGRWGRDRGTHLFTQLTLTDGTKVFCNSLRLRVKPEWFDSIQNHQTQFEVFFHAAPNLNHANRMLTCLDAWPSNCLVEVTGLGYTPQIGFLEVTSGLVNKLLHGAPLVMCNHMLDPHHCPDGMRCRRGHIRPIWLDHHNAGTAAVIASSTGQSPSSGQQQQQDAGGAGGGNVSGGGTPKAGDSTATGTTSTGVTTVGGLVVSTGKTTTPTGGGGVTVPPIGGISAGGGAGGVSPAGGAVTPPGAGGGATPPGSLTPRAAAAAAASVHSVLVINGMTFSPPMRWSLVGGGPAGAGGYQVATSISYRLEEWARADPTRRVCGHGITSGWQLDSKGVPFTFVEMQLKERTAFPLVVFMTSGRLAGGPEAAMAGALAKETPPFEVFAMVTPNLRDPNRMTVIHGCASDTTRVRVVTSSTQADMVPTSLLDYTEGLLAVLLAEPGTSPYPPFAWCPSDDGAAKMCPLGPACKMAHRRRGQVVVG